MLEVIPFEGYPDTWSESYVWPLTLVVRLGFSIISFYPFSLTLALGSVIQVYSSSSLLYPASYCISMSP
jgi:hypothetical protein